MATLELILFGGFQARAAGRTIDVPLRKERALLAVLAMSPGEPRSRDKLAGLLWSDRDDEQARRSLKSAISRLRKSFGSVHPPPILSDRESVTLDRTAVTVDVPDFEQLISAGTTEGITRATALYHGDLLDGLDVRDPAFEEWLLCERLRLRDLARDALGALLDRYLASGARDQASVTARRLLALDPLREAAHRALMQVYAEQRQTALALRQYHLCRDALQRELGVSPEAETEQLYHCIQEKRATARRTLSGPKATFAGTSALHDASSPQEPEAWAASTKPTIAVLPFVNLSGDVKQEYFSDGITDDIITGLSHFYDLFVTARGSSFVFKGRSEKIQNIGRELGVRYIVEGRIHRLGGKIAITVQLVDTGTGNLLWAQRYDSDLKEIFAVLDDLTRRIVATITGRAREADRERALRKRPEDLLAYDLLLRGRERLNDKSMAGIVEARGMFERAIALDSGFSTAYADLANTYLEEHLSDWTTAPEAAAERGLELAKRAVAQSEMDAWAHLILAGAYLYARRNYDLARIQVEEALALNPNEYWNFCFKAWLLTLSGDADEGVACSIEAIRLNPFAHKTCLATQSLASYCARRYEEGVATIARIASSWIELLALLAASYAQLDREAEARSAMAEYRMAAAKRNADYPGENRDTWRAYWARMFPFKDAGDLEHLLDGLRKAGLPV